MLSKEQIKEYFNRIGQPEIYQAFESGKLTLSLAQLRVILMSHALTFPFENLDMHNILNNPNERPTPIELDAIFAKLVRGSRGGYCFETTELLRHVLISLGFDVKTYIAKVLWLKDKKTPPFHEMLVVSLEGKDYLVDPGFGTPGPIEPLLLRDNSTLHLQSQEFLQHDVKGFRFILDEDGEYQLQGNIQHDWRKDCPWKPLYAFTLDKECTKQELAESNRLVSASKQSPFLQRIFVTIPFRIEGGDATGRKTLTDTFFKVSTPQGVVMQPITLQSQFFQILETEFNIKLPVGSKLTAKQITFAQEPSLEEKLTQMLSIPSDRAIITTPVLPVPAAVLTPSFSLTLATSEPMGAPQSSVEVPPPQSTKQQHRHLGGF
jgi:N-hydroxyarylamine O-acetyltransferase